MSVLVILRLKFKNAFFSEVEELKKWKESGVKFAKFTLRAHIMALTRLGHGTGWVPN